LETQTLPVTDYRVVVVDNASEDDTLLVLSDEFPHVQVIVAERNLGFAAGANLGLRITESPIVVLLNNDATADCNMLRAFTDSMNSAGREQVAAITGKVLLANGNRINSTGNLVSRTGRGFDRDWLRPVDRVRAGSEVFGFCGAAAALRMSALRDVGLFDDELFLYYEDTDLSWRLRAAGWAVTYEPDAVAHHCHATSSEAGSPFFTYWNERNSLIVFTRHAPGRLVIAAAARRTVGLLWHTARAPLSPVTRARWRAAGAFVARLPKTLRERKSMWADARVPRETVARLLVAAPTEA
jgi:GT2 family glycosyltransferase